MKKILVSLAVIVFTFAFCMPIFANEVSAKSCAGVNTSIIECNEEVNGTEHILKLVVDIMSIGVGVLGVVGISVVGIQYLTAGGSEEKTRAAKRRMYEIIIGLAVYAVFYAILNWLNVVPQ